MVRVQRRRADQSQGNRNASKQHRLAPTNAVENEYHEYKIGQRTDAVVNPGNERVSAPRDPECVVHDCLVVADHVDTGRLSEHLHGQTVTMALIGPRARREKKWQAIRTACACATAEQ